MGPNRPRRARRSCRPSVESLETRALMSAGLRPAAPPHRLALPPGTTRHLRPQMRLMLLRQADRGHLQYWPDGSLKIPHPKKKATPLWKQILPYII